MGISPFLPPRYQQQSPPAVTFILHDAGETKALTPVMHNLEQSGINYSILASGTGKSLTRENPHRVPNPEEIVSINKTDPYQAQRLAQKFNQAIQAKICVTGLVSDFQKQWADFFRQTGRRVIGYYDGFRYNNNPVENPANQFKDALTELLTPSMDTARYFQNIWFNKIPIFAAGQPTLESIPNEIKGINPTQLAQQIGLDRNKPTLLWIGQYGPAYEQAFALFCQSAQRLPHANLLIALHPKAEVDGSFERNMLAQYGLQDRVKILPKSISTPTALTVSDMVLTHHSTMATQAYLQGKNVVFVGQDQEDAFEPLERYGQVKRTITPADLLKSIDSYLWTNPSSEGLPINWQRQACLGIPFQATTRIANYIKGLLGQGEPNKRTAA